MAGRDIVQSPAFVLYGAGHVGKDVLRLIRGEGKSVLLFLDARARPGMSVDGVAVHKPEDAPEEVRRTAVPVIISVFNRDADLAQIAALLRSLGWRTVFSFVELHAVYGEKLGERFWLSRAAVPARDEERIAAAGRLWADESSRELYGRILAARRSGRAEEMPLPNLAENQYFPADVAGWLPEAPLRFVDCGAYVGDTLRDVARMRLRLGAYAAFEPEIEHFKKLCATAREVLPAGVPGNLWPCGVSGRTELCLFTPDHGEAGRIVSEGAGRHVPCVSLDEVLRGFLPNMIKMDIEGAEPDALQGARETIAESRPRLAVSVYHRPDHLWTIPLLVAAWGLGYKLYLRVHAFNQFDVVLYAV